MKEIKPVLSLEDKKVILADNIDIVYKFCHANKSKYVKEFENFESFISECIILAYENIGQWDNERAALSTFVYNTLPWRLLNRRKREKSVKQVSLETMFDNIQELDLIIESQNLYLQQDDGRLLKFIAPLVHKFTCEHYIGKKTYQEIADKAGKSVSHVRSVIYKNLKDIKEKVEAEYED